MTNSTKRGFSSDTLSDRERDGSFGDLPTDMAFDTDAINPDHYQGDTIDAFSAMEAMVGRQSMIDHCRCTAMKYIWRCGRKDAPAQELHKAIRYLEQALKLIEGD